MTIPILIRQSVVQASLGLGFALAFIPAFISPVSSQILPNGAGTLANTQGNQINITGGTQAGANLFHSFQDFNLTSTQIANFLSNPQTQNILARINGGNPSVINGLLQVSGGNSHLFLMNPAGIIFGENARLNVPASFTATTANSIGFGNNNLFNDFSDNNFSALTGSPNSFLFTTTPAGSIVNAGNLVVGNGQNLSLIVGNTLGVDRLTASGGEIQVLAVPGTNRVRLSQPGQVLSLEFVPPVNNEIRAVDLPTLLTGSNLIDIQVNEAGQIQVAGATLSNQQGVAIASGNIQVPDIPLPLQTFLAGVNPRTFLQSSASLGTLTLISSLTSAESSARTGRLENFFQFDFQQYLGTTLESNSPKGLQETQALLKQITEKTGAKPALVYAFFASPDETNNFDRFDRSVLTEQTNRVPKDNDILEVILVTATGESLRVQLPDTTRRYVLGVARSFRSESANFLNLRGYLIPAQQMYQWILAPLEEELQKQGINNLIFLMDSGLRAIPLAALHDGKGFIVDRYSVGLIPSLNLTKLNYNSLQGAQVLAMGATDFTNSGLNPLPAVSLELNTVSRLWEGSEFLNERFTINNLIEQRQINPFRIVHLATHGVFNAGDRSNSFIQFWDQRLRLNQLDQLNWGNPPVDLLVLSACQTAVGDKDAELGFAGLAVNAGVRTAIASLWEVNDASTLGLMTEFYQQLQTTTTKAEALRQAQLAMIRGEVRLEGGKLITPQGAIALPEKLRQVGDRKLTHPYYWSAFTLVGNPW